MFKIKGRYSKLGVEIDRFTQTLDTNIKEQVRQAAREWLRAVIQHVPIWTGTAMASLQPLGAYLKVAVPTNYEVVRKGYGASVGRAAQEFKFGRDGYIWYFEFTEEVAHYLVNEYFNVNGTQRPDGKGYFHLRNPGPWKSFKFGEEAFLAYINTYLIKRVPNLHDFIEVQETRFDG